MSAREFCSYRKKVIVLSCIPEFSDCTMYKLAVNINFTWRKLACVTVAPPPPPKKKKEKKRQCLCVSIDNHVPCLNYPCIKPYDFCGSTTNVTHGEKNGTCFFASLMWSLQEMALYTIWAQIKKQIDHRIIFWTKILIMQSINTCKFKSYSQSVTNFNSVEFNNLQTLKSQT